MKIVTAAVLVAMSLGVSYVSAQTANCRAIAATARMARANSVVALTNARKAAADSYRMSIVFAYRDFQLSRTKSAAERLVNLIPKDSNQQAIVMTLGDSLCPDETSAEMLTLSKVSEGIAREWSKAVLLAPHLMFSYVVYSFDAVQDPHSDYAIQMRRVCQQEGGAFRRAVKQLPQDRQAWLANHILNPASCKPLALPEADE